MTSDQTFLDSSRALWDGHARRDPLWAILSDPDKKGGRWDLGRFFQTGIGEIALRLYQTRSCGIHVGKGQALDFGCGVGRLTQALAAHFDRVVGLDVSPEMVALANRLNRAPRAVSYVASQAPDLRLFKDNRFDFIVSNIVLQHIEPAIALGYLRELFRVLAPGGVLIFQLPSHERGEADGPPPPAIAPMPDEAYSASIRVHGAPSAPLAPGSALALDVEVRNRSPFEWNRATFGVIRAGNHWLDQSGRVLIRDDGRTDIPETVPSGGSCRVTVEATVPGEAGDYVCEVDLAHEGVTWFGDKGSPTAKFEARAGRAPDDDGASRGNGSPDRAPAEEAAGDGLALAATHLADPTAVDPGDFPMYAVPTDRVRGLVAELGGELFHVENDRSCGDAWVSFRYFVQKRA